MKILSQNKTLESQLKSQTPNIFETEKNELFEDILNKGLSLCIKVTGRSMSPFLRGGEILTIRKVPCSSLEKGDLLFFKNRHGFPIIHRIIKTRRTSNNMNIFLTRGDALIAYDSPVNEHEVLGKVCNIQKNVSGKEIKHIDMESFLWKKFNYLIALLSNVKSIKIHLTVFRICKVKYYKRALFKRIQVH